MIKLKRREKKNVNLDWIDDFVKSISHKAHLCMQKNLLIIQPNKAIHIEPTGMLILKALLEGVSVHEIANQIEQDKSLIINAFITNIKQEIDLNKPSSGYSNQACISNSLCLQNTSG